MEMAVYEKHLCRTFLQTLNKPYLYQQIMNFTQSVGKTEMIKNMRDERKQGEKD